MSKHLPSPLCLAVAAMLVGTPSAPALAQSPTTPASAGAPHQTAGSGQTAGPDQATRPTAVAARTPDAALLQAATDGDFLAAKAALDHGANPNVRDDAGRTPLMRAVFFGYPDVVNVLLDRNPDLRAVDASGTTALGYAVNNRAAIGAQADGGTAPAPQAPADPPKKKHGGGFFGGLLKAGKSLLSAAAPLAMLAAGPAGLLANGGAMGLLGHGAGGILGGMGMGGGLPGMFSGGLEMMGGGLGMTGGLPARRGGGRGDAMNPAAMQGLASNPAFLQKMQDIRAKVAGGQMSQEQARQAYQDAIKGMGGSPTSGEAAERSGQTSTVLVQALLDKGAGINDRDKQGVTPLISAARLGSTDVVKILLSKGADVTIKDAHGLSALRCAKDGGHADIAEMLQKMGAPE